MVEHKFHLQQSRFNSLADSESQEAGQVGNMLPNASDLNRKLGELAASGQEQITEEDFMERKMILNMIYTNDFYSLADNKTNLVMEKNLNWLQPHP